MGLVDNDDRSPYVWSQCSIDNVVTRVGYMVLSFKKYLMSDMPPFPTTFMKFDAVFCSEMGSRPTLLLWER